MKFLKCKSKLAILYLKKNNRKQRWTETRIIAIDKRPRSPQQNLQFDWVNGWKTNSYWSTYSVMTCRCFSSISYVIEPRYYITPLAIQNREYWNKQPSENPTLDSIHYLTHSTEETRNSSIVNSEREDAMAGTWTARGVVVSAIILFGECFWSRQLDRSDSVWKECCRSW